MISFGLFFMAIIQVYGAIIAKTESDAVLSRNKNSVHHVINEKEMDDSLVDGNDVYEEILNMTDYDVYLNGTKYTVEDIKQIRETDPSVLQKKITFSHKYTKSMKVTNGVIECVTYLL